MIHNIIGRLACRLAGAARPIHGGGLRSHVRRKRRYPRHRYRDCSPGQHRGAASCV